MTKNEQLIFEEVIGKVENAGVVLKQNLSSKNKFTKIKN